MIFVILIFVVIIGILIFNDFYLHKIEITKIYDERRRYDAEIELLHKQIKKIEACTISRTDVLQDENNDFSVDLQNLMSYSPSPKKREEIKRKAGN